MNQQEEEQDLWRSAFLSTRPTNGVNWLTVEAELAYRLKLADGALEAYRQRFPNRGLTFPDRTTAKTVEVTPQLGLCALDDRETLSAVELPDPPAEPGEVRQFGGFTFQRFGRIIRITGPGGEGATTWWSDSPAPGKGKGRSGRWVWTDVEVSEFPGEVRSFAEAMHRELIGDGE